MAKQKKTKIKAKSKSKPPKQPPQVTPHPQAGRKIIEFEDELDKQLAGDTSQEPKRGPGRPPKERPPTQPEISQGPQLQEKVIDRMLRIPFSIWSESTAIEALKLTDREAADLAAATKELLDFYIPNLPAHLVLWSNFTIAAIVIMQPRLAKIKEIKKQKARPAQETTDGSQSGQGGLLVSDKFPTIIETEKV